jgi:hypothetical protein
LSKVSIQQKGTGLLIDSADMQGQAPLFPSEVRWKNLAAFEVFSGNNGVEPSEPISESVMIALPHADAVAYRATLTVVSGEFWWTAATIVADT